MQEAPWYVVPSDDKRRARLYCIHHLLICFDYEHVEPEDVELPPRQRDLGYNPPPPKLTQPFVPQVFWRREEGECVKV